MQNFSIAGKHFLWEELFWRTDNTACMMLILAFGNQGELFAQLNVLHAFRVR